MPLGPCRTLLETLHLLHRDAQHPRLRPLGAVINENKDEDSLDSPHRDGIA
ncbi:hypothetical protein [Streptomyces sp. CBMA152]|uniref:hypothetical protein n=1 Tax=Streptomyces sp. CBMA152 TaxID=1896312 RepID=UPI0016605DE3|nr:hypothetical protein [Streptomyces sp. CBMA152]